MITSIFWLVILYNVICLLNPSLIPLCQKNEIQSMLLTASSIIFALVATFVISKFFNIQKYRLSFLNKFLELQISLVKYQRALFYLGDQLEQKYTLFPTEYKNWQKLMEDGAFKNDPIKKPFSRIFTLALKDFGRGFFSYSDTDLQRKIMGKPELETSHNSIEFLHGFLTDADLFREVFSELNISDPYNYNFQRIRIAEDTLGLKEYASEIAQETDRDRWEYLDFWDYRISEASTIVKKMLVYTEVLHDYKAEMMQKIMLLLMGLSMFGIIIPMILLSFIFNPVLEWYVTYISIAGFLETFLLIIIFLYDELTSTDIFRL